MRMIRSIMKYIIIKYLFDASDINLILYKWLNLTILNGQIYTILT